MFATRVRTVTVLVAVVAFVAGGVLVTCGGFLVGGWTLLLSSAVLAVWG